MAAAAEMQCGRLGAGFGRAAATGYSDVRQFSRWSSSPSCICSRGEVPPGVHKGGRLRIGNPNAGFWKRGLAGSLVAHPPPPRARKRHIQRGGRVRFAEVRETAEVMEAEVVDDEEAPDRKEDEGKEDEDEDEDDDNDEDEELGIDKDGNITATLPDEYLEMMKDRGDPINYWFIGLGVTVLVLARKAIWAELQRWTSLLIIAGSGAVGLAGFGFAKLVELGGQPLTSAIVFVASVALTINNFFKLIMNYVPPGPVLYAIILSSIVLVVGQSASNTYDSAQREFPSRNTLDLAGILGLAGFVGLIPPEAILLGLAAITANLLLVRKVNPVAGFTPVTGVLVAVGVPLVRYPTLVAFIGASLFRCWREGSLSMEVLPRKKITDYPRVLTGLLYLVGVSIAAQTVYYIKDMIRAAILLYSK